MNLKKESELSVQGDLTLLPGLKRKGYNLGSLKLQVVGSSGEKLTVLDFGQIKSGNLPSRRYDLPENSAGAQLIIEYSYKSSTVYGTPDFNCTLEDLIHLD